MDRPFLLVQISDPHIGANWAGDRSAASLAAAIESVRTLCPRADAVLVTGDLADHAADAEYEQVRNLLARLSAPLYVLAGNHDDRRALHRHFDVPGADGEPVQYAADLGPLRLVAIDTTRPGEDPGALDAARLSWLDDELAAAPQTPTLLAMHHPPLPTGVPALDEVGLPAADRQALEEVAARQPQVCGILAGHVHRVITGVLADRPVLTAPSTYVHTRVTFGPDEIQIADEPTGGFALHVVLEGELVTHIQPVGYATTSSTTPPCSG